MSDTRGGLRNKWRGLSFEAKVTAFLAPLLVFAITFTAERILGDRGGDGTTAEPEHVSSGSGSGGLEVVALRASEAGTSGAIELVVRNTGESVSVITEAALTVREVIRSSRPGTCEEEASESSRVQVPSGSAASHLGFVGVSGSYAVSIPPGDEDVVDGPLSVAVNQDIAPDAADRFSFQVEIEGDGESWSVPSVYLVDVAIHHDGGDEPLETGSVLVGIPLDDPECAEFADEEVDELRRLAETAEGSPAIAEILSSDP